MRLYSSLEKEAIAGMQEEIARRVTDECSLAAAKINDRLMSFLQQAYREGARDGYSEALREKDTYGSPNALLREAKALVDSGLADWTAHMGAEGSGRLHIPVGKREYDSLARLLKDIKP